jgi:hypothetical protein
MAAPFRLDQPLPITRQADGRFREVTREAGLPPNPIEVAEAGGFPDRWAPGIGQGTAQVRGPTIPWPAVEKPRPMKLGG